MAEQLFDLSGKKALITGAGRGIGKAVALGLARAGADVGLVARNRDQLEQVAELVEAQGRKSSIFVQDLTEFNGMVGLAREAEAALSGLDILVNNAGINIPQPAEEVTEAAWDSVMNLNLKAAFFLAQAVGRQMIARAKGGRIINISSQTGSVALIKRTSYCSSKAGLNMITKVLALEWAKYQILVNAVAPTFVETEFTRNMLADPDFREYALSKNLLKRFGTPEDVTGAVVYLASASASMVTGHILMVDAGWTSH